MAKLLLLLLSSSAGLGLLNAEPDYCKRGVKVSEAYQHCFEEAHFQHPFLPLAQHHDILDGCMVEAYATHTCREVKPAALRCFERNVTYCDDREKLLAIADQSGGACYGNNLNREFKEHVLNWLEPVRGDSDCFVLADRAYECYSQAGAQLEENNPDLHILSVDEFMPVANEFFDNIYSCFIAVYRSNQPLCENWQIPLLLELQGTALPSLFGMSFTAQQMDKLQLPRGCRQHHYPGSQPTWRHCVQMADEDGSSDNGGKGSKPAGDSNNIDQQLQQQEETRANTLPPFLQQLQQQAHQQKRQLLEDNVLPPFLERLRRKRR